MRAEWEAKVKAVYPEARIAKETTYGKCQLFTCMDPVLQKNLGPTAFSEDSAWEYACERILKQGATQ
jgi:hypothetical protein